MAYFIKLRQGGIEGPVHDRKGPFVSEELAVLAAQPLSEQAPDGFFVTVEKEGRAKKANPKKRNPRPTIGQAMSRLRKKKPIRARSAVTRAIVEEAKYQLKLDDALLKELRGNPKKRKKANPRPTIKSAKARLVAGKKVAAKSRVTRAIVAEAKRIIAKEKRMKGVRKGTGLPGFHSSDLFPKKKKAPAKKKAATRKKNPGAMLAAKTAAKRALPYARKAAVRLAPHAKKAAASALEKAVKQLRANRRKKVK
jgi:hypothetical protein